MPAEGGLFMRSAYLYNFLIEANIMAVIAILLMIPLRRFFRKTLGNSALCFGWLLIAIRLLLPLSLVNPLIHEIRSPFAADAGIRPIAGQIKVRVGDVVEGISDMFWKSENRPAYDAVQRLTIDINLKFHNIATDNYRFMDHIAIIELKRDGRVYSPILSLLNQLRIKPHGFSKYCIGSALTNSDLHCNRLKPRLHSIERILIAS